MERPKHIFPAGSNTCTLPTGWIAVPLHQYRSEIKELAFMSDRVDQLNDVISDLKREKLEIQFDVLDMKNRLAELKEFFEYEPYAETMMDRWRDKKKTQEAAQEKDNAEAEDF